MSILKPLEKLVALMLSLYVSVFFRFPFFYINFPNAYCSSFNSVARFMLRHKKTVVLREVLLFPEDARVYEHTDMSKLFWTVEEQVLRICRYSSELRTDIDMLHFCNIQDILEGNFVCTYGIDRYYFSIDDVLDVIAKKRPKLP